MLALQRPVAGLYSSATLVQSLLVLAAEWERRPMVNTFPLGSSKVS